MPIDTRAFIRRKNHEVKWKMQLWVFWVYKKLAKFEAFGRVIALSINFFFPEEWMTVLLLCPQREKERRILLLLFALLWIRNSTAWKTRWLRETIKRHLFKKREIIWPADGCFVKKKFFSIMEWLSFSTEAMIFFVK